MVMRYHWGLGVGHQYTQVYSTGAKPGALARHEIPDKVAEENNILLLDDSETEDEPNTTVNVAAQANLQSTDKDLSSDDDSESDEGTGGTDTIGAASDSDSSSSGDSSNGEILSEFEDDYDRAHMKEIDDVYADDYDPFSYD